MLMVTETYLHMAAIQKYHILRETVVRSIRAGNDLLIFSNNPLAVPDVRGFQPRFALGQVAADIVLSAIAHGEVAEARIEVSWRRLARVRDRVMAFMRIG